MFKVFGRLFGRKQKFPGTLYVSEFLDALEDIAVKLSSSGTVRARLNQDRGCAELYTQEGTVVAEVHVFGECCAPTSSRVRTSLPGVLHKLFVEKLPAVEFEAMATGN